jgi:V/A-type H+-transporting ATPase subunit E
MQENKTLGIGSSSGIEILINRLHKEGVEKGRTEAKEILNQASIDAKNILHKANTQAQKELEKSKKESDAYEIAGKEALKTAMRDMVLELKSKLVSGFSADVKRLVSHQLQDPEVLKKMILEVAGNTKNTINEKQNINILLPVHTLGLEELREDPDALKDSPLTEFVFGLTKQMLEEGVSFSASNEVSNGLKIQLEKQSVILDLTEKAVSELLLQHLQPRFRAILEGVIK